MHTDNNGHATFTIEIGRKSDLGVYDTELEVTKDSYQSSFEVTNRLSGSIGRFNPSYVLISSVLQLPDPDNFYTILPE
jgi:hypothetical protein